MEQNHLWYRSLKMFLLIFGLPILFIFYQKNIKNALKKFVRQKKIIVNVLGSYTMVDFHLSKGLGRNISNEPDIHRFFFVLSACPMYFFRLQMQCIITLMCSFRFCAWLKCSSTHLSQWSQIYFWKFWAPFVNTVPRICYLQLAEQFHDGVGKGWTWTVKAKQKATQMPPLMATIKAIYFTENRQFYLILKFSERFWPHCDPALLCFFCCHQWRHLSGFLFGFYSPSSALPYSIMKLLSQLEIAYSGNCIRKLNSKFSQSLHK